MKRIEYCLFIILSITAIKLTNAQQSLQQQSFSNVCQSGIREDNTNYIYCARRGLTDVPIFSKNNVVYDELVLADNKIAKLTATSFARIKVKKIYLNGNPIRSIEPASFSKLENHLEELWLDADSSQLESSPIETETDLIQTSSIVGLPKAIVNYLRNLNTLRLKGLYVKVLENSILKRLNRIEVLSLQFCSIEKIEPQAFEGLQNSLKELYLDGNLLQYIPTDALINGAFKSLRVLSISQNNIKTINSDSFGNFNNYLNRFQSGSDVLSSNLPMNTLNKLDLSYNGLKLVDSQAFNSFNNSLEILLLQNNEINSYNLRFLRQLNSLKELNLDFNLITKLASNLFINSQKLQYLSLQGNSIQFDQFDDAIVSSSSEIEQSLITRSVFEGLVGLQRVNLARNGIKYLPIGLFLPMKQLKSLILDKNAIENFKELTFDGLFQTLMNISLQNTKMKSKNLISLKNFEKLERVKLGFNDLDLLDLSMFDKMHSTLTNLDLQNNQIDTIQINSTPTENIFMENLLELDLSNNKLCNVNTNLLNKLPKLKNLGLSQNPLYCDCNLLSLYEWTRRKFDKDMLSFIQWQCEVPSTQPLSPAGIIDQSQIYLSPNTYNNQFEDLDFDNYNLQSKSKSNKKKFVNLVPSDFVCQEGPSKCLSKALSIQGSSSIRMTQNPFIKLITPSTPSSSSSSSSRPIIDINNLVTITVSSSSPNLNNLVDNSVKNQARISDLQLRSRFDSVEVAWGLDTNDFSLLNEIKGFKISYSNQIADNKTNDVSSKITSFITDKYQRNFKLENLNLNTRYSVCVSILRSQGYDKYCKEISTPDVEILNQPVASAVSLSSNSTNNENVKKSTTKKQIKQLVNSNSNQSISLSSLSDLSINTANINTSGGFTANANVLSGLMITVLIVLICFIIALIVFIYIYVKKCKSNKKIIKSKSSLMNSTLNTMNSRRNYSLGTILNTNNNNQNHLNNLEQAILSQHQFTTLNNALNNNNANNCCCNLENNPNNFLLTSASNNTNNELNILHSNANCIKIAMGGCTANLSSSSNGNDTSTVSSTLSSVNNNNNNHQTNQIKNMYNQPCEAADQSSCMLNDILSISPNQNSLIDGKATLIATSNQSSDLQASSPSSFTHFKIQPNQQQQIPVGYMPYDMYNCYQNGVSCGGNSTLIFPIHQHSQQNQLALKQYLTMSNNSKKMSTYEKAKLNQVVITANQNLMSNIGNVINQYGFIASSTAANENNDHVYCEIPSTIGRSYRQPQQQQSHPGHFILYTGNSSDAQRLLINNNHILNANMNINSYDQNQIILANSDNNNNLNQRYSQQNSSASLLLSSTSSATSTTPSSSSTSPQSNSNTKISNNNLNFLTASII